MIRKVEFRKVQELEVHIGDKVEFYESVLRTLAGVMYYYTVEPALAMSNNTNKRVFSREGVISDIREDGSEWIITVDVNEPD